MIVSASRRTDIPACYPEWLLKRLRQGHCLVPNPYNPRQVSRISLQPRDVAALVLWSKNPRPLLDHYDEMAGAGYFCLLHFTINDYPPELEPRLPPLSERIETFRAWSGRLGPERVIWRYDPVIISSLCNHDHHRESFARLLDALAGHTRRVMVSLLDFYRKTTRRLGQLERRGVTFARQPLQDPRTRELLVWMRERAASYGLRLLSCCEDLSAAGIAPGACIDGELLARLGRPVVPVKDRGQRPACHCTESRDIGVPDTCGHGCRYCYATADDERALRRLHAHRPDGACLWREPPG